MEACVRHLRVPTDKATGRASFLLIQDTLQTLGQQAICREVPNLLLLLVGLLVTVVGDCHRFAGGTSVTAVHCAKSSSVQLNISVGV